jgi:hypothetical protein
MLPRRLGSTRTALVAEDAQVPCAAFVGMDFCPLCNLAPNEIQRFIVEMDSVRDPARSLIQRIAPFYVQRSAHGPLMFSRMRVASQRLTTYVDQRGPLKSATRLPSPSTAHASTSKPAESSRVTWEGMPLRYSVIEVPHHPGSCRRNLSGSKTYHVISLERRPSSPNSDTTQRIRVCAPVTGAQARLKERV